MQNFQTKKLKWEDLDRRIKNFIIIPIDEIEKAFKSLELDVFDISDKLIWPTKELYLPKTNELADLASNNQLYIGSAIPSIDSNKSLYLKN